MSVGGVLTCNKQIIKYKNINGMKETNMGNKGD